MKVPYPSVSDNLAVAAHMYICRTSAGNVREFIKCQTLKPYMLTKNIIRHYCDEQPDINRNPFQRPTRIDCDKAFYTRNLRYDLALRTIQQTDICEDLFKNVESELIQDGYQNIHINEKMLMKLNSLITII